MEEHADDDGRGCADDHGHLPGPPLPEGLRGEGVQEADQDARGQGHGDRVVQAEILLQPLVGHARREDAGEDAEGAADEAVGRQHRPHAAGGLHALLVDRRRPEEDPGGVQEGHAYAHRDDDLDGHGSFVPGEPADEDGEAHSIGHEEAVRPDPAARHHLERHGRQDDEEPGAPAAQCAGELHLIARRLAPQAEEVDGDGAADEHAMDHLPEDGQ
mmetsp:Transcript_20368/g.58202  ORF Transcript_20368/g.58202 Transcript_20368/m.58202 type:complete len:215 (+) Transcript_20368:420-1064(+)